jgi:Ca2+:H+ antiporter
LSIINYMLLFVPLAMIAEYFLHAPPTVIFLLSALALIPLAAILGEATEELSLHTGPKIGGLIQATLGNSAELIIALVALKDQHLELVRASLTGSIIGNILLVLGLSLFFGGLRNGAQYFDRTLTGMAASMLLLAVTGLIIPTLFEVLEQVAHPGTPVQVFHPTGEDPHLKVISLGVAAVLITIYILSMIHLFTSSSAESHPGTHSTGEAAEHTAKWDIKTALGILATATIGIVFMSEFLVDTVDPVGRSLGVRPLFLGVIAVPIVGNVAENAVAIVAARKNNVDLTMAIALGSSMQIALFVAPLLVFLSLLFGQVLTLFFSLFEVTVLGLSIMLATSIALDGESNWLEGATLLGLWIIAGLGFFFID